MFDKRRFLLTQRGPQSFAIYKQMSDGSMRLCNDMHDTSCKEALAALCRRIEDYIAVGTTVEVVVQFEFDKLDSSSLSESDMTGE